MAYDAATGTMVLFGGFGASQLNDTWTWNGTTWTQHFPATSPPGRSAASMAYDAATGDVVLFGGSSANTLNDTWTWNGTTWTQRFPINSPPIRSFATMSYDATTSNLVLFGGVCCNGVKYNDTWIWNGTTWTQQSPTTSPPARYDASLAYDATSGTVLLFGGLTDAFTGSDLNDTWTWNGTTWTQQSPATSPPARYGAGVAYNEANGEVVLFGGASNCCTSLSDTWTWNGTTWTQQSSATSPPARYDASMAYDAATGTDTLFGGDNGGTPLNDAWTWGMVNRYSTSSADQYTLNGSDGSTWQLVDRANLSLTITPSTNSTAVLVGNADLWTGSAGFNQDLGLRVTPQGGSPTIAAWKESGGFAGTFSPNAAAVQAQFSMSSSTTYVVALVWKSNKPMPTGDRIYAGAGQPDAFSPSTLAAQLYPATSSPVHTTTSTQQYTLTAGGGNNGNHWRDVDPGNLSLTIAPAADSTVMLTGNADLWTANAGINQDLGIQVTPMGGTPVLVGWKESGGFAGTYSPNAAFVQVLYPMTGGVTYTVSLQWQSNKAMNPGDTIWMAAGQSGSFSPTTLFAVVYPTASSPSHAVSSQQYTLTATSGDDGTSWRDVAGTALALTIAPTDTCQTRITANADLWTATAGINQDLGIQITPVNGTPTVVAWKESGGFAGTYSPNAAYVQATFPVTAGMQYTVKLEWKSNRAMQPGDSIWIGAGSPGSFSPTSLFAGLVC